MGRCQTGLDEKEKTAWYDVVFYAGDEREIRLDLLDQAVISLSVRPARAATLQKGFIADRQP